MFGKDKDASPASGIAGFIGKGMRVEGVLNFEHTVRLDGEFKGEIAGKGTLVVGEGAVVDAEVKVDVALVTGLVRGVVEAETRVELKAPGKVYGEIKTPNLIIGDGAIFEGSSVMVTRPQPAKPFEVDFSGDEEDRGEGAPVRGEDTGTHRGAG